MDRIIGGVFSDVEMTERAIKHLTDIGYSSKDISVLTKDKENVNKVKNDTGAITLSGIAISASGQQGITLSGTGMRTGISKAQAKQYEQYLKDGKNIVLVEAGDDNEQIIYRVFLSNKTENTEMYPEEVVNAQNRENF
ncbi:general stress protein [Virgibacillus xinjiangensis]|uniref:General stress protein n=1 Tax=Virgibacillus xinjiangensis TaxID=393090 RepID=A0ABV7CS57_9BACI